MVSIPKIIAFMSCSFVLFLSLSNVTQAADKYRHIEQGVYTIKGKVLRVDGDDYLIKQSNGKEVKYRVDSGTEMSEPIGRGDRIEAKVREVNEETRVLSLRQLEK
jgi:copper chaperone CopZ